MGITEDRRQQWQGQLEIIREAVEIGQLELNDLEKEFYDSVYTRVYTGQELSFRQSSKLRQIYNRVE